MNRAARSMRSGSSLKLTPRATAACAACGGEVGGAAERVDQLGESGRELERHGVDREVAARQVGLDGVGEDDVGLARVGRVGLGPVGRDLVVAAAVLAPIVPKRSPWVHTASAQPARMRLDLAPAGRRWCSRCRAVAVPRRAAGRGRCRRRGTAGGRRRRSARPAGASSSRTGAKRSGIIAATATVADRRQAGEQIGRSRSAHGVHAPRQPGPPHVGASGRCVDADRARRAWPPIESASASRS